MDQDEVLDWVSAKHTRHLNTPRFRFTRLIMIRPRFTRLIMISMFMMHLMDSKQKRRPVRDEWGDDTGRGKQI